MSTPPFPDTMALARGAGEEIPALLLPQREEVVLVMDLVESVRLMAADEQAVIASWCGFLRFARTVVLPRHGGRLVKSLGDGIMAEFDSAHEAVGAALDLHRYFDDSNASLPPERRMHLRAGLNATRVWVDDVDIYGSGVNLAARVATLAAPGETMVTEEVRDGLVEALDAQLEDMGECHLKHVAAPLRVYRVGPAAARPLLVPVREYQRQLQVTLAVIPLKLASGAPEHRAIGELIADAVIGHMVRAPHLSVISRLSAAALRDRQHAPQALLALLGADYVVSGTYHVQGERLLCAIELCDTRAGTIVWTDRIEGELQGLFRAQAEVPLLIAQGVLAALMNEQARSAGVAPLPTLRSSTILLGAMQWMHQSSPYQFERSRAALDYLVERHPRSSMARAWRAKWSVLKATRGLVEDAATEAHVALDHTRRALDAEPENALALAVEGFVYCHLKADLATAHERIAAALRLDPSCSLGWLFLATVQSLREDQGASAVASAEKAMALSPLDPIKYYYHSLLAAALLFNGELERALQEGQRSWHLNKVHAPTLRVLAIAAAESGDSGYARAMVQRLRAVEPALTVERYLSRRPVVTARVQRFAQALASAGLPLR